MRTPHLENSLATTCGSGPSSISCPWNKDIFPRKNRNELDIFQASARPVPVVIEGLAQGIHSDINYNLDVKIRSIRKLNSHH